MWAIAVVVGRDGGATNTVKKWRYSSLKASKTRGQTLLPPLIASSNKQCTNIQGTLHMRQITASYEIVACVRCAFINRTAERRMIRCVFKPGTRPLG